MGRQGILGNDPPVRPDEGLFPRRRIDAHRSEVLSNVDLKSPHDLRDIGTGESYPVEFLTLRRQPRVRLALQLVELLNAHREPRGDRVLRCPSGRNHSTGERVGPHEGRDGANPKMDPSLPTTDERWSRDQGVQDNPQLLER